MATAWPTAADAPRRAADSRRVSGGQRPRRARALRAHEPVARQLRQRLGGHVPAELRGGRHRRRRRGGGAGAAHGLPRPARARARRAGRRVRARRRQGRAQGRRRDAGAAAARQLRGCARAEERRAPARRGAARARAIAARAAGDVVGDGGGGARLAGAQTDGRAGRRGARPPATSRCSPRRCSSMRARDRRSTRKAPNRSTRRRSSAARRSTTTRWPPRRPFSSSPSRAPSSTISTSASAGRASRT